MHYVETGKAEGRDGTALRSTEYGGTDYAAVFNAQYYLNKYADLKAVFGDNEQMALMHFIECGMKEGRQAIESFDVSAYKARYADLRASFGENLESYYMHYIKTGKLEGRYGTIE